MKLLVSRWMKLVDLPLNTFIFIFVVNKFFTMNWLIVIRKSLFLQVTTYTSFLSGLALCISTSKTTLTLRIGPIVNLHVVLPTSSAAHPCLSFLAVLWVCVGCIFNKYESTSPYTQTPTWVFLKKHSMNNGSCSSVMKAVMHTVHKLHKPSRLTIFSYFLSEIALLSSSTL